MICIDRHDIYSDLDYWLFLAAFFYFWCCDQSCGKQTLPTATGAERKCFQSSNKASLLMSYFWLYAHRIPLEKSDLFFSTAAQFPEEKPSLGGDVISFSSSNFSFICSVAFLLLTMFVFNIWTVLCDFLRTWGIYLCTTKQTKFFLLTQLSFLVRINSPSAWEKFDVVVLCKPQVPFRIIPIVTEYQKPELLSNRKSYYIFLTFTNFCHFLLRI